MHKTNNIGSSYHVRNYQPADFDQYVRLITQAEVLEPNGRCIIPEFIREYLFFPEQNLLLVEVNNELVGYLSIWPELIINRLILDCWIHPDHRRRGLAKQLTDHAIGLGRKAGAKYVHVNVPENNTEVQKILVKLGFKSVRRYLEMGIQKDAINRNCAGNDELKCRCMQAGEEEKLAEIQNRAFTGTWGYNPNTIEEIRHRINMLDYSPQDIILICKQDKVVGYCWTRRDIISRSVTPTKGQILMLGVDQGYRGSNVGRRVLLAGISRLIDEGLQVIELIVDSQNETALKLYQSVGFTVKTSSFWYEKIIS